MSRISVLNTQDKIKMPFGMHILIRRCCVAVLKSEGVSFSAVVSVILVDNREIRRLNCKYRNIDKETDVLSFPLNEELGLKETSEWTQPVILGDIVISLEKAFEQAQAYNHSFRREIGFLTVHSMFHLLGFHHEEEESGRYLREKEEAVLSLLRLYRTKNDVMRDNQGKK